MATSISKLFTLGVMAAVAATAYGCSTRVSSDGGGTDSNTHWLDQCSQDADCGDLRCLCGLCTRACQGTDSCVEFGERATCEDALIGCEAAGGDRVCVAPCEGAADCPSGLRCESGQCTPRPTGGDGGVKPGAGGSPAGGDSGLKPDAGGSPAGGGGKPPGAGGGNGSAPDSGAPTDACAPMDARSSGARCLHLLGYTWDGAGCQEVQCECGGADCDRLHATREACVVSHRSCLSADGGAPTLDPYVCGQPIESGPCFGFSTRYAYFPASAQCVPFTYGLCGGNANNFDTLERCNEACAPRADSCALCPDGVCGSAPDLPPSCADCPATGNVDGEACTTRDMECNFLPACGITCRCDEHGAGNLVWECVSTPC